MLAARGVSLGLGRINLSELNHIPKADKALLGKLSRLKREQKAEQRAQQAKLVVHKHVDSKKFLKTPKMGRWPEKESLAGGDSDLILVPKDGQKFRKKGPVRRGKRRMLSPRAIVYFSRTYRAQNKQTLWIACVNVIVGAVIIAVGLLMTVLGYFDSTDHFLSGVATPGPPSSVGGESADTNGNASNGNQTETTAKGIGWFGYVLRSMQYVGPVLCGVGMFLMIIACVITLESRDRHAQIIQEETTELRRSRRSTQQRRNNEAHLLSGGIEVDNELGVRENGLAPMRGGSMRPNRPKLSQASVQSQQQDRRNSARKGSSNNAISKTLNTNSGAKNSNHNNNSIETTKTSAIEKVPLFTQVHVENTAATKTRFVAVNTTLLDLSSSEASSTDAMQEYTFPNAKEPLKRGGIVAGGEQAKELKRRLIAESLLGETARVGGGQPRAGEQQPGAVRRKSTSCLRSINRSTPRGNAPLVRVESVVELSQSMGGSALSSLADTPVRKKAPK